MKRNLDHDVSADQVAQPSAKIRRSRAVKEWALNVQAVLDANEHEEATQSGHYGPQAVEDKEQADEDYSMSRSNTPSHGTTSSRSTSPSKSRTAGHYRARHLKPAGLIVEATLPEQLRDEVDRMLDIARFSPDEVGRVKLASDSWRKTAMRNAANSNCGEREWTAALEAFIRSILPDSMDQANNRDFNEALKPKPYTIQPQPYLAKRTRDQSTSAVLPSPSVSSLSNATPHLPPPAEIEPLVLSLTNPRPDIVVAYKRDVLERAIASRLDTVQPELGAASTDRRHLLDVEQLYDLISDPGKTALELHFPFLLAEIKSGATGGTLFQAQNQAAVGGACLINMLQRLHSLIDVDEADTVCTPIVFSITSEGPTHQLWVHWRDPGQCEWFMTILGVWHVTMEKATEELGMRLAAIIRWANNEGYEHIVDLVARLLAKA